MDGQDLLKVSRMYVSVFRSNFPFPASLEEDAVQEVALRLLESEGGFKAEGEEKYLTSRYARRIAFRTIRETTLLDKRPVSGVSPKNLKKWLETEEYCKRFVAENFDLGASVVQSKETTADGPMSSSSRRAGTEVEQPTPEDQYFDKEERELAKKLIYFPGVDPRATQRFEQHLKGHDEPRTKYAERAGKTRQWVNDVETKALKKIQFFAQQALACPPYPTKAPEAPR